MAAISVIVTTYNWPQALQACLLSLFEQQDDDFEIIVADDGSGDETRHLLDSLRRQAPVPLRHVHHEDRGFRAGTIRNKAAAAAHGDYLLFLDGDCIVLPYFIARHRQLAEAGFFVPGNRVLLSQAYTERVLREALPLHRFAFKAFVSLRLTGKINRLLPLLHWPLTGWRYRHPQRWQKAMTCNLAVWRADFLTVNGFDELFEGWGYEDSDLVIRLLHAGVRRKEGRFALPVLHLWHRQNDRSRHDSNYRLLMDRLADSDLISAAQGVDRHLPLS